MLTASGGEQNSYEFPTLAPSLPARFPTLEALSMLAKEISMLDILFFGGGLVLFCLLIAYERLCHRL